MNDPMTNPTNQRENTVKAIAISWLVSAVHGKRIGTRYYYTADEANEARFEKGFRWLKEHKYVREI